MCKRVQHSQTAMTEQKTSVFARISTAQKKAFYAKVRAESAATPSGVIRKMIEMYLSGQIKI